MKTVRNKLPMKHDKDDNPLSMYELLSKGTLLKLHKQMKTYENFEIDIGHDGNHME